MQDTHFPSNESGLPRGLPNIPRKTPRHGGTDTLSLSFPRAGCFTNFISPSNHLVFIDFCGDTRQRKLFRVSNFFCKLFSFIWESRSCVSTYLSIYLWCFPLFHLPHRLASSPNLLARMVSQPYPTAYKYNTVARSPPPTAQALPAAPSLTSLQLFARGIQCVQITILANANSNQNRHVLGPPKGTGLVDVPDERFVTDLFLSLAHLFGRQRCPDDRLACRWIAQQRAVPWLHENRFLWGKHRRARTGKRWEIVWLPDASEHEQDEKSEAMKLLLMSECGRPRWAAHTFSMSRGGAPSEQGSSRATQEGLLTNKYQCNGILEEYSSDGHNECLGRTYS